MQKEVGNFTLIDTRLPEVKLVKPQVHSDIRGESFEFYKLSTLGRELGYGNDLLVQGNRSRSWKQVLRGLHYQLMNPQGKLAMVLEGAVLDVAVDIRPDSPTFKQWVGVILDSDEHHMLWIPPGYAHGFIVLSPYARFQYLIQGNEYTPGDEYGIAWNDPDINIDWRLNQLSPSDPTPILDPKGRDASWPTLATVNRGNLPIYTPRT